MQTLTTTQTPGSLPRTDATLPEASTLHGNLLPIFLHRYRSHATRRAYRADLTALFGSAHVTLEAARSLTHVHVNEYLRTADLSASTLARQVAALRSFYAWLIALGGAQRNPADPALVRAPSVDSRPARALSKTEARAMLDACQTDEERAVILIGIYAALRRSEIAAIRIEHVRSVSGHDVLTIPESKTGAHQYVKLHPAALEAIRSVAGDRGTGLLFRAKNGKPRSGRWIYRVVLRVAARAGVKDVSAHSLRHTACTLALEGGARVEQVQDLARHKSIDTTMLYLRQRDKLESSATNCIEI